MPDPLSADLPELALLAQLAGVAPSKMAAAFNEPEQLFTHITLEELARIAQSTALIGALAIRLADACKVYFAYVKRIIDAGAVALKES